MSETAPLSILRTISGDSYGNVKTKGDGSGMICDENNREEDDKVNFVIRTIDGNNDLSQNSSQEIQIDVNVRDENSSLPVQNTDAQCGQTDQKENLNAVKIELPSSDHGKIEEDTADVVESDNCNEHDSVNRLVENGENQITAEENVPSTDNDVEEILDDNDANEMDYSKSDTKENISLIIGGESKMEESDENRRPIKKTHCIHLIPEAFEEDTCDDDLDRNSQLSSYDGDGVESDIPPVLLNTNCISARSDNRPPTTSSMCELPGGLRAKANTPASFYNNNDIDSPGYPKVSGRLSSRESRDEVFNRAMTLMSNRCTSARGGENGLFSSREPPFGVHIPQYFFVHQKKPQSLAPLKAWRGYKGNVYFEPMLIQRVQNNDAIPEYLDSNDDINNNGNNNIPRQLPSRSMLRSAPLPQSRASTSASRGFLSSSASSRPSYRLVNSSNQVYVMDKSRLVNENNSTDLRFIEGMESTGSLSVSHGGFSRTQSNPSSSNNNPFMTHNTVLQPNKDKRLLYKRDKICRGSNFHKSKDKSELGMNRNNKVISIKISDPKKKLITPDNSRRTSAAGSRMSNRKNAPGSANSNSNARHKTNPVRSMELVVNGDRFAHLPPKVGSSTEGISASHSSHRHPFPVSQDRITLDDMDAFINASDVLPRVNQVHVTLGNMAEESLPPTTPAFSDNESNEEDQGSVDFVDMNFKGLTTATTIPVDSGY